MTALFVGPVRNCSLFLDGIFKNIENLGRHFKSYSAIFVESDSTDNSLEILKTYAEQNPNIFIISLGNLEPEIKSRTLRIATARNVGIDFAETNGLLDSHDLYIQMCVDDVNSKPMDIDGVLSCFDYDVTNWAGMTANQRTYYDLWTLRKEGWLNYDCWYELYNRPSYMDYQTAYNILIGSRHIKIPKDFGLIEVDSAHGGFSIYKSEFAKGCRYLGVNRETNFEESDIVEFCRGIRRKGGKIFINSKMINIPDN